MDPVIHKIAVLLIFALVLMGLNLKAGVGWLKVLTLYSMVACLAGAGWLVFDWVFLP